MRYLVGSYRFLMVFIVVACMSRTGLCDDVASNAASSTAATSTTSSGGGFMSKLSSSLSSYSKGVGRFGSEMKVASDEALKAGGRFAVATFGALVSAWNGVSRTAAVAGKTVASGYQSVNNTAGRLPIVGTVTSGVGHALNAATATFDANSKFDSDRRTKFINDMRTQLNSFKPASKTTDGATTTAAATSS